MRNAYALLGLMFLVVFGAAYMLLADRSVNEERAREGTDAMHTTNDNQTSPMLSLSSPAFEHNARIPSKYTCDQDGINPELHINGIPEGTKTLVLLMDDPDIPTEIQETMGIETFDHWVLYNISPDTTVIKEGTPTGAEGLNSRGAAAYAGPCPPKEYEPTEHRYIFRLFALETSLGFEDTPGRAEVRRAMEGHIIAETELIGLYERN